MATAQRVNEAYEALQLEPQRKQAFHELSWSHFRSAAPRAWLRSVRSGSKTLLPARVLSHDSTTTYQVFDRTLESLVFAFAAKYARVIWPMADEQRGHLTSKQSARRKWDGTFVPSGALEHGHHTRPRKYVTEWWNPPVGSPVLNST